GGAGEGGVDMGGGAFTWGLASAVGPAGRVAALDISGPMASRARGARQGRQQREILSEMGSAGSGLKIGNLGRVDIGTYCGCLRDRESGPLDAPVGTVKGNAMQQLKRIRHSH